ncbi:MAG TPA: 2'-5' RNA ligase family protein [Flavisolibacter sp.]
MEPPLIITLMLDESSALYFNTLRKTHFPPERNFLEAHLTLFHNLPAQGVDIIKEVEAFCKGQKAMTLEVSQVVSIGAGVAFKIQSPELEALHKKLQQQWEQWLIPQDRQKLWPHITVQNKVSSEQAKALQLELAASFTPFSIQGLGLSVWHYLGGPWRSAGDFQFGAGAETGDRKG